MFYIHYKNKNIHLNSLLLFFQKSRMDSLGKNKMHLMHPQNSVLKPRNYWGARILYLQANYPFFLLLFILLLLFFFFFFFLFFYYLTCFAFFT